MPRILLEGFLMAIGFLTMWQESWLPKPLEPKDWQWNPERGWTHNFKDRMCARVRKDVEWWQKFQWFTICLQFAIIVSLIIGAYHGCFHA